MSNRYNEHDDSIRQLSKEDEQDLAWQYHDDAGLRLVYPTFASFVLSRTSVKVER